MQKHYHLLVLFQKIVFSMSQMLCMVYYFIVPMYISRVSEIGKLIVMVMPVFAMAMCVGLYCTSNTVFIILWERIFGELNNRSQYDITFYLYQTPHDYTWVTVKLRMCDGNPIVSSMPAGTSKKGIPVAKDLPSSVDTL